MTTSQPVKLFESTRVRSHWDAAQEKWYFSVVDVVQVLTDSTNPTDYLKKLRKRDVELGSYLGTNCPQVAMPSESGGIRKTLAADIPTILRLIQSIPSPKAELIFTALAELSTRQIAETEEAKGLQQNAKAGKEGGRVAKRAKDDLEKRTGQKVVTGSNFLPPGKSMPVQLSATPERKTNKSPKK